MAYQKILIPLITGSFLFFSSCGKDSNITGIFKTSGEESRLDSLLALGRIHYDRGEHDEAYEYANKAYNINPGSEDAAILLSYILLGQAGVDPFQITKTIILKDDTKTTSETNLLAETDAASALDQFADLLDLSSDDYDKMGTKSSSTNSLFDGLEVFLPKKPDEGPRTEVETLRLLVKAIKTICPFVSDAAKVEGYSLHECTPSVNKIKNRSKSNFLWGLAHLIEALAYNSVLLYTSDSTSTQLIQSSSDSNLFKKVSKLDNTDFEGTEILDYVDAVGELQEDVNAIFDTSEGSMLYVTLANLTAVSKGFGAIVGMPDSVTKKIDDGIKTIEKKAEQLSSVSDSSSLNGQSKALKTQLNKKVSGKLKTSISSFNESIANLPADKKAEAEANKEKLCNSYKDINGGDTTDLPTGC